jgi:CheY-like chemotaxis protein
MKKLVLIVEDDPLNMELVRDLIQVQGHDTIEAGNGKQGIELAMEKNPQLILMDIQLPLMDGIEATKNLKADPKTENIPIIALTAFAMKGDKETILEAGFDGYIAKPIDIKFFRKMLAEYL